MTREAVLNTCGLPDGIRWQPKLVGRWYLAELCSAPAYVYGTNAVAFGCDSKAAWVQNLTMEESGMLEQRTASLLDDLTARRQLVATVAQLQHQQMTADEQKRAIEILRGLQTDADPQVRRAAERTLAALRAR